MRPWPMLGLALILGGPLLVNGVGRTTVVAAGSGTVCASSPSQTCVQGANCTAGGCQCEEEGSGDFVCYNTGVQRIEIRDGVLQVWDDRIKSAIRLPCRLRLTALETTGSGVVSSCYTQVFSIHQVKEGSILLTGVDVFFHVTLNSGEVRKIGFRITGTLGYGYFSFEELGTTQDGTELPVNLTAFKPQGIDGSGSGDGDSPIVDDDDLFGQEDLIFWGSPQALVLSDGGTISSYIDKDNFGVVQAPSCFLTVKFRPSEVTTVDSSVVSGLSVAIDEGSGTNSVLFPNSHTYVAGPLQVQPISSWQMTSQQILLSLALRYEAQQDGSNADQCRTSGYVYHKVCESDGARDSAVMSCSAFLEGNLMRCLYVNSGIEPRVEL